MTPRDIAREREQRLHDLTSAEEHILARWLCEHEPAIFDKACAVIDKIRRLDEHRAAKETPR